VALPGTEPAPRHDRWRILGPGGGGAQFIPSISPHDSNLVLVACDMTGDYISENGGSSWREFNLGGRIRSFAFDPTDPKVIYARGQGVWRSGDRGRTWELVYPEPATVTGVTFLGDDEAPGVIVTKRGISAAVNAFATDPVNPAVLYLSQGTTVSVTRNRGRRWEELISGLPGAVRQIYVDPRSPATKRRIYLIGTDWTAVWDAGKLLHANHPQNTRSIYDASVGFPAGGADAVMYIITDFHKQNGILTGGFLLSRDGGQTWQPAYDSLLSLRSPSSDLMPSFSAVATSKLHPDVVYLSLSHLALSGAEAFGVAKSVDGTVTWKMVWQENSRAGENIRDAWATETFGPDWAENPLSLGLHDSNPDIVYGTDYGRTLRSLDGGKTWAAVYSHKVEGGGYATTGIDVTTCYGIHFDPFDAKRQFISYTDIGLFRSEDGGRSWFSSGRGVPRRWRNTTYWVVFDPKVRGRMWGAFSGTHDLPRTKMFRRTSPATFKGGVGVSEDGGKTWKPSNQGMPDTAVTHILLDPSSPTEKRVLYAAAMGRGVYKSIDDGASWTLKNNGLIGAEPMAWRLALDGNVLYLVTIRRSEDANYGTDRDGMLYRSTNGAESWQRIPLPAGVNGPTGIAVDPWDSNRLYVSAWGRYDPRLSKPAQQGGIWLSADDGRTWRNVLSTDQFVYDISISPHDKNVLFAAGFQSSIWSSANRGESWERIRGFNFKAASRVIPDPQDRNMIYVATYGSSIWHGPVEGDPTASEDIVWPPAVRYSR
jgi:hypothetical protein